MKILNSPSASQPLIVGIAVTIVAGLATILPAFSDPGTKLDLPSGIVTARDDAVSDKVQESVVERFKDQAHAEDPDFQRHVAPLLGRLGCNGRSCHGSFQGQGGFQLSLFGYDFEADHKALLTDGRVDIDTPSDSLILTKPCLLYTSDAADE